MHAMHNTRLNRDVSVNSSRRLTGRAAHRLISYTTRPVAKTMSASATASATATAAFASLVDASAALDPALFAPAVAAANHYLAEHTQFQLHSLATEQRHKATWRLEQQANANAEVCVCVCL